jgi:energy-coupling factor transport system permease protein
MIYRRQATPLHAARAGVGAVYCLALALAALLLSNPILLAAVTAAVLGAAWGAGVGGGVLRTLRVGLPLALMILVFNALLDRNGLTVIARLGDLPVVGHTDVTLEAILYGAILGLRAIVLIMCGALYSLAVDPDELLRALRPVSFRSALTATLATRLIPVLMRDSRRLAEAQRCRAGDPPSRLTLMRATTSGIIDRALDVAAVLEVRGFALGGRGRPARRAWSRHDLGFMLSAAGVVAMAIGSRVFAWASFSAYPSLQVAAGAAALISAAALFALALLPFADRRGVGR